MPLSTDQLPLPPTTTTTTIPKDRRADVFAVFRKEIAFRRKSSSATYQQEILKKTTREKPAKAKKTSNHAQSRESNFGTAATEQTRTHTAVRRQHESRVVLVPPVVNDTTSKKQKTNTVEAELTKTLVRVTTKPAKNNLPQKNANKRKFHQVSDNKKGNGNISKKQRKSSRIKVKEFRSGSLLQFQPLSKQDKAAILSRKKPRIATSNLPKPSNLTLDDTNKPPSSKRVVSRSVSPASTLPQPCNDVDDWQTRVRCCGSCAGCTVKVNCGRCQQCALRTFAPPFQQALLRCMHRICSAPLVVVSMAKLNRRPDPPVLAKKDFQNMKPGSISPPETFTEARQEKTRLDP